MGLPMMRLHFGYGFHHGTHIAALVFLLLVIAALVVGVLALLRLRRVPAPRVPTGTWRPPVPGPDPALSELRLRYARGELSSEEYTQRAANLGFPVNPGSGPFVDPDREPPAP